jgi:Skp family chaperone for outer membrane proteins
MAKALRNHVRLKTILANLEEQKREHAGRIEQQRRDLAAETAALEQLAASSPQRLRRQKEIDVAASQLELLEERKQAEFAKQAATAHYLAHSEIRECVKRFSQRHALDLVLNYDSSDVDADNPDEIMRRLDDRVVYQSRIDITEHVIALVNE